jgi:hypothetical protein
VSDEGKDKSGARWDSRFLLAAGVLTVCTLGVFICGITIILFKPDAEMAKYVFAALLPLAGTWVGTILAYYFSKEHFDAASKSVRDMARTMTPMEKLRSISVVDKMIRLHDMVVLRFTKNKQEDKIDLVGDILKTCKDRGRNRLPVLDEKGHPKYMMHRSMIDQYLAGVMLEGKTADEAKKLTLGGLLGDDAEMKKMFEESFVCVSQEDTLAEAKLKLENVAQCSDVFVTKTGGKDEPVIGWLTNVMIAESAKA